MDSMWIKGGETLKYWELEQKLYSFTEGFDAEDLVSYDKKYQEYMPTRKFDDETPATKFLDEYDKEVFWDELIEKLGEAGSDRKTRSGNNEAGIEG